MHGRLEFTDNPGGAVTSFTQADINSGRLRYIHDGSETTSDSFGFTTADATTTLAPATFGITVDPVDDPSAVTANTGATVAEGGTVTLTTSQLNAGDVDSSADELTYTVTAAPTAGHLEFSDNAGVQINSFTQADINAGRVRYVNDSSEAATDTFSFALSDGTTTLAAATTLHKTNDSCVQTAGASCSPASVRSGLGGPVHYTGIANDNLTTCTNTRCRVDVSVSGGNLSVALKRALSESPTSTAYQTYTMNFAQVVPVPAAVWLFGSALGLMGFARRKAA